MQQLQSQQTLSSSYANVLETDSLLQDDDTDDTDNDHKYTDVDVEYIPNPNRKVKQTELPLTHPRDAMKQLALLIVLVQISLKN